MLHDPDLLILDETTDGLDPMGRSQIRDLLAQLKSRGKNGLSKTAYPSGGGIDLRPSRHHGPWGNPRSRELSMSDHAKPTRSTRDREPNSSLPPRDYQLTFPKMDLHICTTSLIPCRRVQRSTLLHPHQSDVDNVIDWLRSQQSASSAGKISPKPRTGLYEHRGICPEPSKEIAFDAPRDTQLPIRPKPSSNVLKLNRLYAYETLSRGPIR